MQQLNNKIRIKAYLKAHRFGRWLFPWLARSYFLATLPFKQHQLRCYGWQVLGQLHGILTKADIPYFIDFGTLLGMIRESGFIRHDLDLDLGVLSADETMQARVREIMNQHGFQLKMSYWYRDRCTGQSFMCGSVKVDFGYYETEGDRCRCWLFYCNMKERVYPSPDVASVYELTYRRITGIETIRRQGVDMNAPVKPERLLEDKYGPDWRQPDKGWRYWLAPSARECPGFGKIVNH